jgi:2-desacetyl-2-hydroxyethyl bacteriochlorophyllide A dehydrogenase
MQAAQIVSPNQLRVITAPEPQVQPEEVMIEVKASGICGTDIHIFRGDYLGAYPVIPGHEFAGIVTAVGSQVRRFKKDDRVAVEPNLPCDNCINCLNNRQNFCLNWQAVGVTRAGGMAQYVTAPEKAVFAIGDLPFEAGAFMEPLSCVLHGLERLQPEMGCNAAILGAGPIGILLLQGLRLQGAARVTVVDKNAARAEFASQRGADQNLTCLDELPEDTFDVVIDATGALPVMRRALDFARPGGKVLWFGVPPSGKLVEIEPFKVFRKGLTVLSSFTSVRNSYQALDLLRSERINLAGLVSHRLPLEGLEHGINILETGLEGVRKVQVLPNG